MDPVDFWSGLPDMLAEHHGPRGRRLGGRAALSIAYALIILPWVMVATAFVGIGGVLYLIGGTLDAPTAQKFGFVALALLIGLPVSLLITYVTTRGLKNKMTKNMTEERHQLREHRRKHNEAPAWHFVINTPDEAREKRAEIREIILSYYDDIDEEIRNLIAAELEHRDRDNERG